MTPKQILHVIQTKGLKETSGTAPLACLVTMLHSQVRGDRVKNSIFFKLPGRMSLFMLKKNALQWTKSPTAPDPVEPGLGVGTRAGPGEGAEQESCDSMETVMAGGENDVSVDETSSSASCSTEPQTRLSRSTQSGRQRKKAMMMPCVVLTPLKVNGEHVPSGPVKRTRGVEVDFETPGSILVNTNIRALINTRTFAVFPPHSQQQLLHLLPEVDWQVGADGLARLSSSALNNEFFTHASQCWKERLAEGEFTHEMQARFRQEMEKEKKVEAWKEKFFEEYHGQRLGLTWEESLKLTVGESTDGMLQGEVGVATAAGVAPKRRCVGRRCRDGRMRRQSQADLRRRARRTLCKPPLAQLTKPAEKPLPLDVPATPSSAPPPSEPAHQGEAIPHFDSAPEPHAVPAFLIPSPASSPAPSPFATDPSPLEVSPRLLPEVAVIPVASSSSFSFSPSSSSSSSSSFSSNTQGASSDPPSAITSLADPLGQEASISTAAVSPSPSPAQTKEQKRKGEEPHVFTCFPEKRARVDDCQSFRNTVDCVHSEKPQPTTEEPKVPPIRIQLSRIKPPWVKGPPTYQICPRIVPPGEGSRRGGTGARTLADIKARAQQARAQREAAAAVASTGGWAGPGGGAGPGARGGAGVPDHGGGRRSREHPGPVEPGGAGGERTGAGQGQGAPAKAHQPGAQLLLPNLEPEGRPAPLETMPPSQSWSHTPPSLENSLSEEDHREAELGPTRSDLALLPPTEEKEPDVGLEEQNDAASAQDRTATSDFIATETDRDRKAQGVAVALTSIPDTRPRFEAYGIDTIGTLTMAIQPPEGKKATAAQGVDKHRAGRAEVPDTLAQSSNRTSEDEEESGQSGAGAVVGVAEYDVGAHSDSTETASDFENETGKEGSNTSRVQLQVCLPEIPCYRPLNHVHPPNLSQSQTVIHAYVTNPTNSQPVIPAHPFNAAHNQLIVQAQAPLGPVAVSRRLRDGESEELKAPGPASPKLPGSVALRKSLARPVSSVEANNPLVTQLLQGSLPLERVLPPPHSASKLEINRLPPQHPPLPQPHPPRSHALPSRFRGPLEATGPVESSAELSLPIVRLSPRAGQGFNVAGVRWEGVGQAACLFEEASSRAAGMQHFLSQQRGLVSGAVPVITSLASRRPTDFIQNAAAYQSAIIREHTGPQSSQDSAPEQPPGGPGPLAHCRTTPDASSPPHGDLCPSEVIPTVKINWRPKTCAPLSPAQPSVKGEVIQALAKNLLVGIVAKKEIQSCGEVPDSFLTGGGAMEGLLNMEMSLLRMAKKEQAKSYLRPGDSSSPCPSSSSSSSSASLPFQVSVQQQLYSKLPKLQQQGGMAGGFSYTANVSVVDCSGFSRNIAGSVLQLRQGSGRQSAALSIQAFAKNTAEEVAFKCSCRLKAMIMCQGCGAFCHDDCIGPSKLCVSCLLVR